MLSHVLWDCPKCKRRFKIRADVEPPSACPDCKAQALLHMHPEVLLETEKIDTAWQCEKCNLWNLAAMTVCESCQTPKP